FPPDRCHRMPERSNFSCESRSNNCGRWANRPGDSWIAGAFLFDSTSRSQSRMSNESQLQVSRRLNRSGLQRTLLLATAMLSAWNVAQADVLLRYDMNSATPTFAA